MMGGTYAHALRRSFIPEGLSMNMMMAGMAPTMIFLMMGRDMRAMEPSEPLFWTVMSLGVVVGFAIAYPVNVWMVSRSLKHGLMTVRTPARAKPSREKAASAAADSHGHSGHNPGKKPPASSNPRDTHAGGHDGRAAHGMSRDVTRPQLASISLLTVLALVAAYILPATQVNLTLSARDVGGRSCHPA